MTNVTPNETGTGSEAKSRSARKSQQAFRTISEVAEELDLPQHVLRFWETKFSQISPMKRGGGRRYYRPEDVELLRTIKALLHFDGYTIKGVQKLLSTGGIKNLSAAKASSEASDSPQFEAQPQQSPTTVTSAGDFSGTVQGLDVAELAVLVRELEEIRDHLKKSIS